MQCVDVRARRLEQQQQQQQIAVNEPPPYTSVVQTVGPVCRSPSPSSSVLLDSPPPMLGRGWAHRRSPSPGFARVGLGRGRGHSR